MKNFYNSNPPLLRAKSATVALNSICGKTQKQTLLFVLCMLLLSFSSFGQTSTTAVTFVSATGGPWGTKETWVYKNATGNGTTAADRIPSSIDNVEIKQGHIVTINSLERTCKDLTIEAGKTGNSPTGGRIDIGSAGTGKLTLTNLKFEIANGTPKQRAALQLGANGHLSVSGAISKISSVGQNQDVTTLDNSKILYNISSTSTIEYNGTNQSIFNFYAIAGSTDSEASNRYGNLILSGTGEKLPLAELGIRGNLTVKSAVTLKASPTTTPPLVHTVLGSISIESTTSGTTGSVSKGKIDAGNSTINVGDDFTSTGTFDSGTGTVVYNGSINGISQDVAGVVYNNLVFSGISQKNAKAGLFTKSNLQIDAGSNFSAGNFTHTVSGNWSNSGVFNAGESTVLLNGANKTISSTNTGAFNNLYVSVGSSSMLTDITVNGNMLVESTILETGTSTLYLGEEANFLSTETGTAHIKGNLQTTRNLRDGGSEIFGNIGIRISDLPSDLNSVTVKRVTGTAFQSNLTQNFSVLRQFHVTTPTATTASLFNATIDMRFPAYELNEPEGTTYYDIYRKNLDGSIEHLTKAETADPYYNYKLNKANRKYGMYTIASNISPLPVELTWFKAQRQAQGVLLTWETASEKENKGFEVQVSTNGKTFSKVAFVDSKVVNSSVAQRYSYTDNATLAFGTRYYRLAQVDLDGTTTFSNIKAVDMDAKVVAAAAFPNPFAEGQEVMVRLPQGGESRNVSLVLTNTMGQVVLEQQAQVQDGQVELALNTAKANAKGLYLLKVIDNGTKYTFKLVKK